MVDIINICATGFVNKLNSKEKLVYIVCLDTGLCKFVEYERFMNTFGDFNEVSKICNIGNKTVAIHNLGIDQDLRNCKIAQGYGYAVENMEANGRIITKYIDIYGDIKYRVNGRPVESAVIKGVRSISDEINEFSMSFPASVSSKNNGIVVELSGNFKRIIIPFGVTEVYVSGKIRCLDIPETVNTIVVGNDVDLIRYDGYSRPAIAYDECCRTQYRTDKAHGITRDKSRCLESACKNGVIELPQACILDNITALPELKQLVLGKNLIRIKSGSIKECIHLEKVVIQSEIVEIDDNIMYYCPSLETIEISDRAPQSIEDKLREIIYNGYNKCKIVRKKFI